MSTKTTETEDDTKRSMDAMYRWTRHIYDATRKYYLLGRDHLIQNLNAQEGEHICEVGCGTARNIIKMAKTYPNAHFYGLDASDEMLKTANLSLQKHKANILLKQAYAQNFDPQALFNLKAPLNKLVFSYALSIIPPWQASLDHALNILPKGGEIHIIDFGAMEEQPKFFRRFMFWFLSFFHVYHKPEILEYLKQLEQSEHGRLEIQHLYKGYSYHALFKKA